MAILERFGSRKRCGVRAGQDIAWLGATRVTVPRLRSTRPKRVAVAMAALLLGLSGCRTVSRLVVVNHLTSPISIRYQRTERGSVTAPERGEFRGSFVWRRWVSLGEAEYSVDDLGGVSVLVAPKSAVNLATLLNFAGRSLAGLERLPFKRIEVSSRLGALCYDGPLGLLAFETRGGRNYVWDVMGTSFGERGDRAGRGVCP